MTSMSNIFSGIMKTMIILAIALYIISPIDLMPGLPFDDILAGLVGISMLGIKIPFLKTS